MICEAPGVDPLSPRMGDGYVWIELARLYQRGQQYDYHQNLSPLDQYSFSIHAIYLFPYDF